MSRTPKEILLVSKPLGPPWNDSGKVYVRELVDHLPARRFRVLVPRGTVYPGAHVTSEALYGDAGDYRPGLAQNLRVLARLLRPDRRVGLYHFFFAPNPRSSHAARLACALMRKKSLQTVLSAPADFAKAPPLLFGDRVVVLSDDTLLRLRAAGFDRAVRIHPGVRVPPTPMPTARIDAVVRALDLEGGPIVLYPGDLEFSDAAHTVVTAAPEILREFPSAQIVLACRPKTERAQRAEAALRELARNEPRLRFCGEVPDMRALLAASAVVALPADTVYAKADLPLVLLEALAEGTPIIVSDRPPLSEILQDEVGLAVPPSAPAALAAAVVALLGDPTRRALMSLRARALARSHFSAEAMAAAYERLYAELL